MFRKFNKVLLGVTLVGGVMWGSCVASEPSEFKPYPLVTSQILYQSAEDASEGKITSANILECVKSTVQYYQELSKAPSEFTIDLGTWKTAKIIDSLRNISNCFRQDLEISPYCMNEIVKICCGDKTPSEVTDKNFRYAKFLIISQCKKWNETSASDIELVRSPDGSTVGTAINMLQSATNGDTEASKKLLTILESSGKFSSYLG